MEKKNMRDILKMVNMMEQVLNIYQKEKEGGNYIIKKDIYQKKVMVFYMMIIIKKFIQVY